MCAQALPCRALKSWCIGQKSYCFKVQKNRIISLAKASTHPLPNIFKVLLSPKWYDFGKLLTLQENKYLTDIWKIATWKVWRPSPSKSSNCNESFITMCAVQNKLIAIIFAWVTQYCSIRIWSVLFWNSKHYLERPLLELHDTAINVISPKNIQHLKLRPTWCCWCTCPRGK